MNKLKTIAYITIGLMFGAVIFSNIKTIRADYGDNFSTDGMRVTSDDKLITTAGFPAMTEWLNIPTLASGTITNSVVGGTASGIGITTMTLVANGTSLFDGAIFTAPNNASFAQITWPRNLSCVVAFQSGGATTTVTGFMTGYGKDAKGIEISDAIAISTNPAYGVKAFAFVSTITFTSMAISGMSGRTADDSSDLLITSCSIHIGLSDKIGIPGDITAAEDVYKITTAGVDYSTTNVVCVDVDNDTIDLSKVSIYPSDGSTDRVIMWREGVIH